MLRLGACALLVGLAMGCGSVAEPEPPSGCGGVECAPWEVCEASLCVDPCEDVECGEGQVCIGGECVSILVHGDDDGFEAAADCDDDDELVFPGSTRPCETGCGAGIEVCRGGEWVDCSAPLPPCDCDPGETRPEPCELCGTAIRECAGDVWASEPGPCTGQGECQGGGGGVEGAVGVEDCAECGTRSRNCSDTCAWGTWSNCYGNEGAHERCAEPDLAFCNSAGICVEAAA